MPYSFLIDYKILSQFIWKLCSGVQEIFTEQITEDIALQFLILREATAV